MDKVAVIFDMDGVIVNTEPLYRLRRDAFFKDKKRYLYDQVADKLTGSNPKDMFRMIIPEDVEEQQRYRMMYQAFKKHYPIDFGSCLDLEICPLLKYLTAHGYKIGLASSSNLREIQHVLSINSLGNFFDVIVSGEQCKNSKPDPEIYLQAAAKLHIDPQQCIAVEDSAYGIEAGKRAEMTVIAKKVDSEWVDQSRADYRVARLLQIRSLLMGVAHR